MERPRRSNLEELAMVGVVSGCGLMSYPLVQLIYSKLTHGSEVALSNALDTEKGLYCILIGVGIAFVCDGYLSYQSD